MTTENLLEKVLYTADVTVTGGRKDGTAKSTDNQLDVKIGSPVQLGGDGKSGTNPEQLFAAGYAACFIGAMRVVAQKIQLTLPEDLSIDAKVNLGPVRQAFGISAELNVYLPNMDKAKAEKLVEVAHTVCPYSNATRGNIEVVLTVRV